MSITFSITASDTEVDFVAMASKPSEDSFLRVALSCDVQSPQYSIHRFHPPGAAGNIIIRENQVGQLIVCRGRYLGPVNGLAYDINTNFQADCQLFANVACTITDEAGNEYTGMNLLDARRLGRPQATGRGTIEDPSQTAGMAWMDVIFSFSNDDGYQPSLT